MTKRNEQQKTKSKIWPIHLLTISINMIKNFLDSYNVHFTTFLLVLTYEMLNNEIFLIDFRNSVMRKTMRKVHILEENRLLF